MIRSLRLRVARVERAMPHPCPACAGRPEEWAVLVEHEGRLTDRHRREVNPAHLRPCPLCRAEWKGKIIVGVDPECL